MSGRHSPSVSEESKRLCDAACIFNRNGKVETEWNISFRPNGATSNHTPNNPPMKGHRFVSDGKLLAGIFHRCSCLGKVEGIARLLRLSLPKHTSQKSPCCVFTVDGTLWYGLPRFFSTLDSEVVKSRLLEGCRCQQQAGKGHAQKARRR